MRDLPLPALPAAPRAGRPWRLSGDDSDRMISRADCEALFHRIVRLGTGGAETTVTVRSTWTGTFQWVRNRPTSAAETVEQVAVITRTNDTQSVGIEVSQLDDATLKQAMQRLDQHLGTSPKAGGRGLLPEQHYLAPTLWSDTTGRMAIATLSDTIRQTIGAVVDAKLVAAGYAEIGAATWAIFNSRGLKAYAVATGALYTETVRNIGGSASGWAGNAHMEWAKLDVPTLARIAREKCVDSANPVAIEPGRYTAILEPTIVSRFFARAVMAMDLQTAVTRGVYHLSPNGTKLGLRVFDPRITITSDPTDPDCGYMPFDPWGNPYGRVTWVEHGILKALAYSRKYAQATLGTDVALPNPQAFRVSGGDTSMEEMIATTERGLLVTNTGALFQDDEETLIQTGVTRDGVWLIERGKIRHPVTNFWIHESPMYIFNNVVQIGPAVRALGGQYEEDNLFVKSGVLRDLPARALNDGHTPIVVPPMKVRDFNFVRLTDAI